MGAPTSEARGVLVFFSGRTGQEWWNDGTGLAGAFLSDLRGQGYWIVQVNWKDSWLIASPGEDAGSGHLACRPGTVSRWVHDTLYQPLGINPGPGQCGFCITGNSGGSSQAAYALSLYGLDRIVDALIPTSGPTHAAEEKGCLRNIGQEHYYYEPSAAQHMDDSAGFNGSPGPCLNHDPSYISRWEEESVDTGANDLFHPTTRVEIIIGENDCGETLAHATDYYDALVAANTPYVSMNVIANMSHSVQKSLDGLAALENAILSQPINPTGTACYLMGDRRIVRDLAVSLQN